MYILEELALAAPVPSTGALTRMTTALKLATLVFCVVCTLSSGTHAEQGETPRPSAALQRHVSNIAAIESREGAYSASLAEPLLNLGRILQRQGRHDQALDLFKRGVHLERINGGLNSPGQIPLLKGAIRSQLATREFELADKHQAYLYRIQQSSLSSSSALTAAFMQQAQWQFDAFLLVLDEYGGHGRLLNMADLYTQAGEDITAREGERSRNLRQPLLGSLQTQYLIASYTGGSQSTGGSDSSRGRDLYRFAQYRQRGDTTVREIIAQLRQIKRPRLTTAQWQAETDIMLGDWLLWSGKYEQAMALYSANSAELDAIGDAQSHMDGILGEPVALPALEGLRWLPDEATESGDNTITVSFDVTQFGRVVNLQRMDENEGLNRRARRLMRNLRELTFRPRFATGAPVETQNIVKIFKIES